MRRLRVLIACEESQVECKAFRAVGHLAFSCDIKQCSGGHPEWHIQQDVIPLLDDGWDIIIAHPPCTYLSNVSAPWMLPGGVLSFPRWEKALSARQFFMRFFEAKCKFVAVENPMPLSILNMPAYSQIVQPYEFGEPWSKRTFLWLKGLPALMPTMHLYKHKSWHFYHRSAIMRSRSFEGIAQAMAVQWSDYVTRVNI